MFAASTLGEILVKIELLNGFQLKVIAVEMCIEVCVEVYCAAYVTCYAANVTD